MARKKKQPKAKEQVRMRFKPLTNGNQSIYLDIYRNGYRSYEFLKMYLVPETDATARTRNANTMRAAEKIKAQRIIDLTNNDAGIKDFTGKGKMLLLDWVQLYKESQERKGKCTPQNTNALIRMLIEYKGERVMMKDIGKDYALGFIDYLRNKYITWKGTPLKPTTAHNYYAFLNTILWAAVRADIIPDNPFSKVAAVDKIKPTESQREYLTIEEVKTLIKTDCRIEIVKRAYLFSVYCGLRLSDIEALTWGQIVADGEQSHIEIVMQKTRTPLYLPLSKQALKWLPARGDADKVFSLPSRTCIANVLKEWAQSAGIAKRVTFHTSRHTFATMMLTLGADLYTTSKLLGHHDIATTQVYAKIVNKKKDEAVNLVDGVFDD